MNPLVSVIVPVYNTSKYLRQCLDSIQSQTLKEIEIICVDDGSTDNSLEILLEKESEDSRITVLQQKNKGGGAARNLGLSVAKGDYLLFLDSDDFFEEIFIEKMYTTAVETSADMVVCQYKEYNSMTGILSGTLGVSPKFVSWKKTCVYNSLPSQELNGLSLVPWNKLCSRKFVMENGLYFQEIKHYNDNYFSITASLSANRISIIPEALVYYRVGMKTNTQSTHYNEPYDLFEVLSAVYQYLKTTKQFQKYEIPYYEFLIKSCRGHLAKLKRYDCYDELYSYTISYLNRYDLSTLSLKKCQNKIEYMKYLKLIQYPKSKYFMERKRDKILFLLKHPILFLNAGGFYLKNAWWRLRTYGLHDIIQSIIKIHQTNVQKTKTTN